MISQEDQQRREYMINLMKDTKGVHYTLGWLGSCFANPDSSQETAQRIVEKTITELEQETVLRALTMEAE